MYKEANFSCITACGECCDGCIKRNNGKCEGCLETGGHCLEWAGSKGCPIAICASKHDIQFCGLCDEFPCEKLKSTNTWNLNAVDNLSNLAKQYKQWQENMAILIKDEDELNLGSTIADYEKCDFGCLFYAEENPTMHDANHAVITKDDDIDKTLEGIKSFYLSKGLTPRIYLRDGQYESMKSSLIAHGFAIENVGKFEHYLLTRKNRIAKTHLLDIKVIQDCKAIDDKLLDNINAEYLVSDPDARERLKCISLRIVNSRDKLYIGYDKSGEPVTMALLCCKNSGLCCLDSVETGKNFQGKGYCRELISKIVDDCDRPLFLSSENPIAIKIYKEAGFTRIKLRDDNTFWRAYYSAKKWNID